MDQGLVMATATSRSSPRPEPLTDPSAPAPRSKVVAGLLHVCEVIFRFLASVKLAVLCLGTLSLTLAVATKFNSAYGMNAANDYIYQTRGFALLMAFLGINVLCAALIRYPWVKRQTGFLITHVGLLVVIGASYWAAQSSDEGLLGMTEGATSSQLIRNHKPAIYVKPIDPHTGKSLGQYEILVRPGAFDWSPGDYQVVSKPEDPFKLAIKGYYACSVPAETIVEAPGGKPMLKLHPRIIPPGQTVASDVFGPESDPWFTLGDDRLGRVVKSVGPAQFIVSKAPRPEVFEDFLSPPADPGVEGVAILHYEDKAGVTRRFDVRLDDARVDKPFPLPDSDLTATFRRLSHTPIENEQQQALLGTDTLDIVQFAIKRGDGSEIDHSGYAMFPSIPAIIPAQAEPGQPTPTPLARINYFGPPIIDPQVNRKFGVVEVMVDRSGQMAYRVFERGNPGKLKAHGRLAVGQEITAFGGNATTPMTLLFDVDQYVKSGRKETIARSINLPPRERDDALPAILAELIVNGVTRDVWLRKSVDFDIDYKPVAFDDSIYELAFDVDRLDLGFSLTLKDFDVGFDPGTANASSYKSEVTLTDEKAGLKDAPKTISMNNVLDYAGWRFFQTNYSRARDKKTGRPTGEFISVFQVARNPARALIYAGCIIVVLGAFVQFYMRAGIFTDGGKQERERAASKARSRLAAKGKASSAPTLIKPIPKPQRNDDFEPL